ncbi:MAG: tRNA-(ms[2]io[6]A)-hydroxylase [Flavobacteriales bacterium]|nr:tRNA-(ms[2]io[6]A)-hydroxylase [Flavobacteriales bacterium]
MKLSIDVKVASSKEWIEAVLADFPKFLRDHADCERKASGMALSFVAKYPDRLEILPELMDTAIEELEHFRQVYEIMQHQGITLNHEIEKDEYVNQLMKLARSGRNERFLDKLLLGSVLECRGAERFKMVADHVQNDDLKKFYKALWTSEAKHGHIFVKFALNYFSEQEVYDRLEQLMTAEAEIIQQIPVRAALH